MGQIDCSETSVRIYHYTLRDVSEDLKQYVLHILSVCL